MEIKKACEQIKLMREMIIMLNRLLKVKTELPLFIFEDHLKE